MADDKPKMAVFDPPLNVFIAKAGDVVSCTADGAFEHQGELHVTAIANLEQLIQFIQAHQADQVRCCIKLDGQVIFIEPWLAFHLEALDKVGRLKLVDVPPPGESSSATESPDG